MPRPIRLRVFHQGDPTAHLASGIDTFIRGLVGHAPPDIEADVVGVTCSPERRPAGRWHVIGLGGREARFYPVLAVPDARMHPRVPMTLKFAAAIAARGGELSRGADLLDFHRVEPSLAVLGWAQPRSLFVHRGPEYHRRVSRWRHLPGAFDALERALLPRCAAVWCVREDAVAAYRGRLPWMADRFHFVPTWVDRSEFAPARDGARSGLRAALAASLRLSPGARWLVSIARLDRQKDPLLLVRAFAHLRRGRHDLQLLMIGDGELREAALAEAAALGVAGDLRLPGPRPRAEVASILQAADLFVSSSVDEGMPMALLEALRCGLPAVSPDVGEVRRVIRDHVNGVICHDHDAQALAAAIAGALDEREAYAGEPCTAAVREYEPGHVLQPVYQRYRELARAAG